MNVLKPIEAAYLAGLVDGEGCIGAYHREDIRIVYTKKGTPYKRKTGYYFDFSVTNTNKDLADHFIKTCGIGQIRVQQGDKPQHKLRHCFVLRNRKDIMDFLNQIVDYMILKKPQALIMIKLARSRLAKNGHAPYTDEENKMLEDLGQLNQKGVKIMNALPRSRTDLPTERLNWPRAKLINTIPIIG